MIPYILVFSISIFFTYLADKYNNKSLFYLLSIFALIPPIILAGFRDETIGTDIQTYVLGTLYMAGDYGNLSDFISDSNIDVVFTFLVYISNKILGDLNGVLIIISTFTLICVYIAIAKMRHKLSMSYAIFVYLFSFFNSSLNLMRQNMAISVCLLLLVFLFHKEYIKASIAGVLAFFCHSSSIFFVLPIIIFIYIQNNIQYEKKIWKWINIYFFLLPLLFFLFDTLLTFFINVGLFSDKYAMYSTKNKLGGVSVNTIFVLTYIAFNVIIYKLSKSYRNNLNYIYSLLITYSTLVVGLLSAISIWAGRLSLYFQILTVIMFPMLIFNLPSKLRIAYKSIFTFLIIFYWWYTYIINNASETYPYTSKILGIN